MTEKFRKIVNTPVKKFAVARKNIKKFETTGKVERAAQVAGIGITGLFQFLAWAVKYTVLDNSMLRKMEKLLAQTDVGKNKAGKDKKVLAFVKKYPNMTAHIIYYMMAASVIGGGYKVLTEPVNKERESKKDSKKAIDKIKVSKKDTYEEFLAQCKPITPFLIGYLINPEGFSSTPYQDSRGIWTIGYGSTMLKTGPVDENTPPITIEEAYELSRWHIEDYETYFIMYCYMTYTEKTLDFNEFLGLASFIYNGGAAMMEPTKSTNTEDKKQASTNNKDNVLRGDRWLTLRDIYRTTGTINADEIKALFEKYPIKSKGSVFQAWETGKSGKAIGDGMANYLNAGGKRAEGLVWRRWLEACLTAGVIEPMDIMNCPIGGVYEFRLYMKQLGKEMIAGKKINYGLAKEFKEWIVAPIYWDKKARKSYTPKATKPTKSIMPKDIMEICEKGTFEIVPEKTIKFKDAVIIAQKTESDKFIELGTKYLYDKNYEKASENYKKAIEVNPNNALAYSDLSYVYLKRGKYKEGTEVISQMLLADVTKMKPSYVAGAYYNSGMCYMKIAEAYKSSNPLLKIKRYKSAKANMEAAKKLQPKVAVYQKRITEITKNIKDAEQEIAKVKKIVENRANFKQGQQNIKQKSQNDKKTKQELAQAKTKQGAKR